MPVQTVMIIRHAEKPDAATGGVDATGAANTHCLTPRGWQRAGAWAQLFCPPLGVTPALPTPTALFAAAPESKKAIAVADDGSKSQRPMETLTPLAQRLPSAPFDCATYTKGQEAQLAEAVSQLPGVVLICWQHEDIAAIAQALAPNAQLPPAWPGTVFNVIYRFDRSATTAAWRFSQVAPVMLAGDLATGN